MRLSLVILFCLFIVVVHSATTKARPGRGTTKAPARKSAYAYLRSIRGKSSCAGGSCPFWQKHGRSFVSLRCQSQQYQECVCLHRMCYKSCLFDQNTCNLEMASCLKQICPRCLPASSLAICSVYNTIVDRAMQSLPNFGCYSCCPIPTISNITRAPAINGVTRPPGNSGNRPGNNTAAAAVNGGNRPISGNQGLGINNTPSVVSSGNGNNTFAGINRRVRKTTRRLVTVRTTKRVQKQKN